MEVSQEIKNRTTMGYKNPTSEYIYIQRNQNHYLEASSTAAFTAALLTIAKVWKQCGPKKDDWLKKCGVLIYIMEFYLVLKKKEILPFTTAWMKLEGIMLSEKSQTKTNNA